MWVDRLASQGLSRSRIASHVAVASAIYAWALTPSRRFVTRNPLRLVELPPNDEKPRLRVAFADEAAELLAALEPEDQVPYALAFYAGLRRGEIARLEWPEVLDGEGDGTGAGSWSRARRACARRFGAVRAARRLLCGRSSCALRWRGGAGSCVAAAASLITPVPN